MEYKSWPYIDWRQAWIGMRKARIRPLRITYDKDFERHFLEDQFAKDQANNYEYGRKAVKNLSGLLSSDFEVLEIGAGPGTLTIPLAEKVKMVTAMEISAKMVTALGKKLENKQVDNVEVIKKDWMKVEEYKVKGKFDLVICSHFLWQVEDLELLFKKMENASRKFCAIIQPSGRAAVVRKAYETIVSHPYQGQFEPDADVFPYIILRQKGRLLNTHTIEYAIKRDRPQLARYVTSFIARYIEIDKKVTDAIADFVARYLQNDFHIEQCRAVVMCWRIV